LKEWSEKGIWQTAWAMLLGKLDKLKQINWEEAIADGTFAAAKKGALR
jgi:hypothetical protein